MGELEPLNEGDTEKAELSVETPKPRKKGPSLFLYLKRYLWIGCRLFCDLLYGVFAALSLGGAYLFLRQLYDYFAIGAWQNGSLLAVIPKFVPQEYLTSWFPMSREGDKATLYWIMDMVPAPVFIIVVSVAVLIALTRCRWLFVVWEQQAMVKINNSRS